MAGKGKRADARAPGSGGGGSGGPGKVFYALLAVVAAGGVAFLLTAGNGGGDAGPRPLPAWAGNVEADADAGVALGSEAAPVTILEFANYQCPHCARFGTFAGRLIRQNYVEGAGTVRWVLYDYLLEFPNEIPAALAARCAAEQGRHWEMHDLILARQTEWSNEGDPRRHFRGYAEDLGLEMGEYRACMEERRPLEEVLASHQYGARMGVSGTPTLFLNGRRLDHTETSYEALEALIRAAADSAAGSGTEAAAESASATESGAESTAAALAP